MMTIMIMMEGEISLIEIVYEGFLLWQSMSTIFIACLLSRN